MTRLQASGLLLLTSVIWGSAFVGQALGMDSIGPLAFTGIRFLLGTLVVLPLAWREWRQLGAAGHPPGRAEGAQVGGLGLLLCAGVVMQQIGLITTSVTNAGFLTALYVPLVPLLAWGVLRQTPHWTVWPAAVGCVAGTWLLSGAGRVDIAAGDWWVIASAAPWSAHVLLVGAVANRVRGPFIVACGQFAVCGVIALALALATEPITADGLRQAGWAIAYTGIVSVGIGFTLQVVGQRHAHAADAAILMSSEMVFAAIFGALFMGDRLGSTGLAGCAIILAGILLVQLPPLLRRTPAPP